MPGKSLPTWPADKPFDGMPTLDELQQQHGLKRWKCYALLRGVPRWRCKDNGVRYDAAAAAAALSNLEEDLEDLEDALEEDAAPLEPPLPTDPSQAQIVILNRATQSALATLQKTLTLQNDVIKAMAEPLRQGMALVKEAQGVLRGRLRKYDAQWDRMITVTEDLQSTQAERDAKVAREAHSLAVKKEAFATVKQYLPDMLSKFQLTLEAGYALEIARSIEPELLEQFLNLGDLLPPEMREKAQRLVEIMKTRRKAATEAKSDAKRDPAAATPDAAAPAAAAGAPQQPAASSPTAEPPPAEPAAAAASAAEVSNDTAEGVANGAG